MHCVVENGLALGLLQIEMDIISLFVRHVVNVRKPKSNSQLISAFCDEMQNIHLLDMKYKLIVSDRLEGIIRNPSVFSEPIQWVFSGPVLRLPIRHPSFQRGALTISLAMDNHTYHK